MITRLDKTNNNLKLPKTVVAFTIIELLVVIAVIAALAAITVIAYVGITNQAHKVALSSGLSESVKALENYKTTNGITSSETYPTKLSDMTNLKLDNSINWTYYVPSTTDNTQNTSYCLQGTVNGITQSVSSTDSSVQTKPCLENGLVGWWKMNGNANDSSGNNNNGTINGGVTTATGEDGVAGHAYSFDGTSGYINVADNAKFDQSNELSISVWAKVSSLPVGETNFIGKGGYAQYRISITSSGYIHPTVGITNGLSITYIDDYNNNLYYPNLNTWVHCVYIFDVSTQTVYMYINGSLQGTRTIPNGYYLSGGSQPLILGWPSHYFSGVIDDARVYNRALSASEVSALYLAGAQ